jgi:hypothetical protein
MMHAAVSTTTTTTTTTTTHAAPAIGRRVARPRAAAAAASWSSSPRGRRQCHPRVSARHRRPSHHPFSSSAPVHVHHRHHHHRGASTHVPNAVSPPGTEEEIDDAFTPQQLGFKDIVSLWVTQILQARSMSHWSPYDRVRVVNADP